MVWRLTQPLAAPPYRGASRLGQAKVRLSSAGTVQVFALGGVVAFLAGFPIGGVVQPYWLLEILTI